MMKGKAMASSTQGNGGRNPWRIAGWSMAVGLLLLPLIAMQFTREVNWGFGDFLFAAMMFGLVGLTLELVVRVTRNSAYRAAVAVAIAATFLLIWSNLAVGFIGNEDNPANALFLAVPASILLGGAVTLFRPRGMSWTLLAAAIVQALVPVAIWTFAIGDPVQIRFIEFPIITAVFVGMWLLSSTLFRKAAHEDALGPKA